MAKPVGDVKAYLIKIWNNPAWKEFTFLSSLAIASICLWIFLGVAEEVGEGEHAGLEEMIMRSTRQPDHPELLRGPSWLAEAARDITALGSTAAISLLTLLTTGYLLLNRLMKPALLIVVAIVGGSLLNVVLKQNFERPRPEVVPHLADLETSPSFPSGHSMSSAVIYLTLGALLARTTPRRKDKIFLIGSAVTISGLIGISRVLLGVHYPSDVLAGWTAGTAWALFCWSAAYWLQLHGKLPKSGALAGPD